MQSQLLSHEPQSSSAAIRTRIGPSVFFLPGALISNPIFWLWLVVAGFRYSSLVRYAVWEIASVPSAQNTVISWYSWLKVHNSGMWITCSGCAIVAAAFVRYLTTSYAITAEGDLVVNTGLLGLRTPSGPFAAYENTVSHVMITDVDVCRNLLQILFGTGTLVVTFSEPTNFGSGASIVRLPFLRNARKTCDFLMSKAGVKRARFVV